MSYSDLSSSQYLESLVQTASPARLRLLLIEKAAGLCMLISQQWTQSPQAAQWDGPSIQLADILTELLSGVSQGDTDVAKRVADLYVFLIQHQNKAVEQGDASMIDEIQTVLETEAETWRMVCAQSHTPTNTGAIPRPFSATAPATTTIDRASLAGSLNLQG